MAIGYHKCPDCGQDVLKTATQCLNCGYSFVGTGGHETKAEETKYARVEIYTPQFRLTGIIVLGGAGYDFRLSDFLNTKAQRFFPLLDAEMFSLSGGKLQQQEVVMVNKEAVRMLIPLEEPDRKDTRLQGIVSSVTSRY